MADTLHLRPVPASDPAPTAEAPPAHEVASHKARAAAVLPEPLLVPAVEAARLCGISEASWYRLKSVGKLPAHVKLGGRVLWSVTDLRLFVSWVAPTGRRSRLARLRKTPTTDPGEGAGS